MTPQSRAIAALELDPDFSEALSNIGAALKQKGQKMKGCVFEGMKRQSYYMR